MLFSEINPYIRYARCLSVNEASCFTEVVPLDARLFFVLNGHGTIKAKGAVYEMQEHSLLIINSGIPYQIQASEAGVNYIMLNFDYTQNAAASTAPIAPVPVKDFKRTLLVDPNTFADMPELSAVLYMKEVSGAQTYLSKIMGEWTEKTVYYENKIGHLFAQCLTECLRFLKLGIADKEKDTVNRILSYVHNHYQENLTNISLGKQFGFHPNYISYVIKRATRKPLHQYIIQVRLLHATELLENTTLSAREIAARCGFCDAAYFSQCFKKHFGVSPSKYAKGYYL